MQCSNFKLAKLSAENYKPSPEPAGCANQLSTSPGMLAIKANITQHGFSVARWLFWRQRLGKLYLSGDQRVAKPARQCFDVMAATGRTVGINISGEKKYLEKLFEALDKELAARDFKGSVGPEDVEIDPAWAADDK
jgi:hypothetical protein